MTLDRIAINARWVLTGYQAGVPELLPNGTVVIRGDRVEDVTSADVPNARRVHLPENSLLLPGFLDLHSHALNGPLFRGMTEDRDRTGVADTLIYDLLMPVGNYAVASMTYDEAVAVYTSSLLRTLAGGTTTVVDMFRPRDSAFLDAARSVGIRAYAAPYLSSRSIVGVDVGGTPIMEDRDGLAQLNRAVSLFHDYDEGPGGRVRVMMGLHCTDTCSPEFLVQVAATARELDTMSTIHVAQSKPEMTYLRQQHGATPVEYLIRNGVCGPAVLAAHCAYATDGDLQRLADTGTPVACCPATFAHAGHAVPYKRFADAGVRTAIGTDGHSLGFLDELRVAGLVSKLANGDSGAGTAADLLRTGTEHAAAVLDRSDLGRIQRGARADLVAITLRDPGVAPVLDPVRTVVWHHGAAITSLVVVNGEILIEEGRHVSVDRESVQRAASTAIERVWQSHLTREHQ